MEKYARIRLRRDISESLEQYITKRSVRGVPGLKMTKGLVVNEVMMNFLSAKGFYPMKNDRITAGNEGEKHANS